MVDHLRNGDSLRFLCLVDDVLAKHGSKGVGEVVDYLVRQIAGRGPLTYAGFAANVNAARERAARANAGPKPVVVCALRALAMVNDLHTPRYGAHKAWLVKRNRHEVANLLIQLCGLYIYSLNAHRAAMAYGGPAHARS